MIRYVAAALAAVVLSAACESSTPTAPSANPQPSAVPPAQPTGSGPTPVSGTPIAAGSRVQGIVQASDPVCFPNWDSSGHCRQFDHTASSDRTLRVTLKWESLARRVRPGVVRDLARRRLGLCRGFLARTAPQFSWKCWTDLSDHGHRLSTSAEIRGARRGAVMKSARLRGASLLRDPGSRSAQCSQCRWDLSPAGSPHGCPMRRSRSPTCGTGPIRAHNGHSVSLTRRTRG
jgi:hypothetical protein